MSNETSKMVNGKPQSQTRMGTAGTILQGVDMRTHGGRRFKELCADLVHHLHGNPSPPQTQIIRRAAALAVWCEAAEVAQAQTGELDIASYTTAANALRRLLADIGLTSTALDVTPALSDYINGGGA
jgi:hypothetical protein